MRPIHLCRLDKVRPVLVLTREVVRPHLRNVTVAPITSPIRGLSTEVVVGQAVASAVTGALVDRLGPERALILPALAAALVVAAGLAHRTPARQPAEPAPELVRA